MRNQHGDRRVRYTKKVLMESLVELLKEKPIQRITIKELCEKADINRSTFYAHYNDQYDLFNQIKNQLLGDINRYLENFNYQENTSGAFQIMNRIFDYILENAESCKVLLGENGDVGLQKEIMMIVQRQGMQEWRDKSNLTQRQIDYMLLFGTNGGIGVVQHWLQTGMKESAREMAETIIKLTYQGSSAMI